jgi:hypothetical protein
LRKRDSSSTLKLRSNKGEDTVVFVKRNTEKENSKDFTIAGLRGARTKKGHVGIEVECEGANLPKDATALAPYWAYVRDGSLRGNDNAEYVLTKPIDFGEVEKAVADLWSKFKASKTRLDESIRTSVHVHLNVLPFYQNRLAALLALWFIFEEPLSYWCGDHRAGNLFCIRAKDGPAIIEQIKGWFENKGNFGLDTEGLHYAALNLSSIQEHGSVEIRTMRGVTTPEPLLQWVRILKRLYDASADYPDPRTLIEDYSLLGPYDFFQKVFGDEAENILAATRMLNIRECLNDGMRFAQDFVYVRDWSEFNPIKVVEDPFGRRGFSTSTGQERQARQPRLRVQAQHIGDNPFIEEVARADWAPPNPPRPVRDRALNAELTRRAAGGDRVNAGGHNFAWDAAANAWARVDDTRGIHLEI